MARSANIRCFRWDDLETWTGLFNEVNAFTDTDKALDLELARQMLSQPLCDPERNCLLAETGGAPAGFALVTPELPIGRAVASGGVVSRYRGAGIGRALLNAAVERAADLGASMLHVQAESASASARRLLEACGFQPVRTYYRMTWEGESVPAPELPPGFVIRSFGTQGDDEVLTHLQNDVFAGSWGFSPNSVEQIRARLKLKTSDLDGIIFATNRREPAAYNWTLRTAGRARSTGWISMTGVRPDHRERGLGRAVLLAGMQFLKSKGVNRIAERWSRLSEQRCRFDKWNRAAVR